MPPATFPLLPMARSAGGAQDAQFVRQVAVSNALIAFVSSTDRDREMAPDVRARQLGEARDESVRAAAMSSSRSSITRAPRLQVARTSILR